MGFMPHPEPGESVRVTVITSCSKLLLGDAKKGGLQLMRVYLVSYNRERVAVGI